MIQAFKDRLATGAPVLVVNPDHPSPSLAELLGRLPVDAVWIDYERGAQFLHAHANALLSRGAWPPEPERASGARADHSFVIERHDRTSLEGSRTERL